MTERFEENLARLAQEYKIASGLKPDVHISLLEKIKDLPLPDAIEMYNYFLTKETSPEVLLYLVKTVSENIDETSIDVLIEMLLWKETFNSEDKSPNDYIEVRSLVARILGSTKNSKVTLPLLYTLNNKKENYKLRLSCADALGQIGNKYAVGSLINVVSDSDEKSVYLRETAAKALGKLRDHKAIEPLVSILESREGFLTKFSFFKERIVEALGNIGTKDERSINALKNALMDRSSYVRLSALEAISKIDDEDEIIPLVKNCLKDDDDEVARSSVIVLYNIIGERILHELLNDDDVSELCKNEAQSILDEYESEEEHA